MVMPMVNVPQDYRDKSHNARGLADFVARHLPQRFPVPADRAHQDDKILDASAEHCANEYPKSTGQITKLRSQHRPHQRPRAGDGGKMMSKDHPLVGPNEIAAIFQALGGRGAHGIQGQHFGGNEFAVEPVTQSIGT